MQGGRVAHRRNPEKTDLALLTQALERRDDIVEHLPDAQRRSAACFGNRIVQVKDVDPVKAQPRQAAFERRRYGVGDAAEIAGRQPDLGADGDVGRFQLLQNAAKVLFGFAVAVLHRGVEIVHAGGERPRDGALLVGGIAAHHDSADRAAAEAQHRELHSRASKDPQLHRCSSGCPRTAPNYPWLNPPPMPLLVAITAEASVRLKSPPRKVFETPAAGSGRPMLVQHGNDTCRKACFSLYSAAAPRVRGPALPLTITHLGVQISHMELQV